MSIHDIKEDYMKQMQKAVHTSEKHPPEKMIACRQETRYGGKMNDRGNVMNDGITNLMIRVYD